MNKKTLQFISTIILTISASTLAGCDNQPTTHNGLVRVPTGDTQTDFDNALEDAKNAFKLHEEARMEGDFSRAAYYEEAAQTAIGIANKASLELDKKYLKD